jgi:1,4-dihydroxy-6-naphthoate synthase
MLIRVGFSADPDDAFMFWGLASGAVDPRGFQFEPVVADIQTLNEWSLEGRLEVSAVSLATYPLAQDRYLLLPHGASMGSGYGPIVVARERLSLDELRTTEILVPGKGTTAFLVLKMALGGEFDCRVLPFEEILPAVASGSAPAGLLIHEGQLMYLDAGLEKCLDLGEWWLLETGLPLPLGVNLVRRDLGDDAVREVSAILRESIDAALANRAEALAYALRFGRGMDSERGERFIGMYVNELTLDYGDEGRLAVQELLSRAEAVGAYDTPVRVEFAP